MVSPWNFPLNLVAHKVAPAIAAGCTFVLKPSSRTPMSALILGEILSQCENLPKGAFSVLPCSRKDADAFTTDERLKLLTFTGSGTAGWDMKARAGKKKVLNEIGIFRCSMWEWRPSKALVEMRIKTGAETW